MTLYIQELLFRSLKVILHPRQEGLKNTLNNYTKYHPLELRLREGGGGGGGRGGGFYHVNIFPFIYYVIV